MDTSCLANRMKEYEKRNQYYLQKRTPVAIRVDGRSFHTFTKGFQRPFDKILMTTMQETAKYMCENIQGAKFAYVQSDEITIILVDYDTLETECWFNYRTDKVCSIAASMATMAFNKFFTKNVNYFEMTHEHDDTINEYCTTLVNAAEKGAMFDARCFNIPKEEVANLIYWRQLDATRNSIQMVAQANFPHKELQGRTCNMLQDKLFLEKGINWNSYPVDCKRGAACIRKVVEVPCDNDGIALRSHWIIDNNMPIIKGEGRNYVNNAILYFDEINVSEEDLK